MSNLTTSALESLGRDLAEAARSCDVYTRSEVRQLETYLRQQRPLLAHEWFYLSESDREAVLEIVFPRLVPAHVSKRRGCARVALDVLFGALIWSGVALFFLLLAAFYGRPM